MGEEEKIGGGDNMSSWEESKLGVYKRRKLLTLLSPIPSPTTHLIKVWGGFSTFIQNCKTKHLSCKICYMVYSVNVLCLPNPYSCCIYLLTFNNTCYEFS